MLFFEKAASYWLELAPHRKNATLNQILTHLKVKNCRGLDGFGSFGPKRSYYGAFFLPRFFLAIKVLSNFTKCYVVIWALQQLTAQFEISPPIVVVSQVHLCVIL